MKHNDIQERLSLLFDERLPESEAREVRRHIEACSECQKTLAAFEALRKGIREAATYEVVPGFAGNVVRAIRRLTEEAPQWMGVERAARRLVFALGLLSTIVIGVSAVNTAETPPAPERYFTGEPIDSSVVRTLLQKEDISKDDVLIAAVVD